MLIFVDRYNDWKFTIHTQGSIQFEYQQVKRVIKINNYRQKLLLQDRKCLAICKFFWRWNGDVQDCTCSWAYDVEARNEDIRVQTINMNRSVQEE